MKPTIDELEAKIALLKAALLYEARVAEAHYEGMKSYPKSRRPYAEAQVARMRELAHGKWPSHYQEKANSFRAYQKELQERKGNENG